jgi:hypothetical protein
LDLVLAIDDFTAVGMKDLSGPADLEIGDTAGLETCATLFRASAIERP